MHCKGAHEDTFVLCISVSMASREQVRTHIVYSSLHQWLLRAHWDTFFYSSMHRWFPVSTSGNVLTTHLFVSGFPGERWDTCFQLSLRQLLPGSTYGHIFSTHVCNNGRRPSEFQTGLAEFSQGCQRGHLNFRRSWLNSARAI